jgi:hypothetical protein
MSGRLEIRGNSLSVIQMDDLVLMQRPIELQERAHAMNRARIDRQLPSVKKNYLRESRSAKPEWGEALRPEYKSEVRKGNPDIINADDSADDYEGVPDEDILA